MTDDEVVADFVRRLDRGDLDDRLTEEIAKLTTEQLRRVTQILAKRQQK